MNTEVISASSPGLLAVSGSWLVANGSSWEAVIFAFLGALVAILSMDEWAPRKAIAVVIFNVIIGAFGIPALLLLASQSERFGFEVSSLPNVVMIALVFLAGWTAHHLLINIREPVIKLLVGIIGTLGKKAGGS